MKSTSIILLVFAMFANAAMTPQQQQIMREYMGQVETLGREMQDRIAALKPETAFEILKRRQTPAREELETGIKTLEQVGKVYSQYKPRFESVVNKTCDRVAITSAADGRDCRSSISSVVKVFEIESAIFAKASTLLQFLVAKIGHYDVGANGFRFDDRNDLAAFNSYVSKISELAGGEESLKTEGQAAIAKMRRATNADNSK